jgi:hypothetical protein
MGRIKSALFGPVDEVEAAISEANKLFQQALGMYRKQELD